MEPLKRALCDAMVKHFGNITKSCEAVNIDRQTYYNWMKADAEFKEAIENADYSEMLCDVIEETLIKKLKEGDTTVAIFMAKTKAKKRGYVEKTEHQHSGNMTTIVFQEQHGNDPISS